MDIIKKEVPRIFLNSRPIHRVDSLCENTQYTKLCTTENHTVLFLDESTTRRSSNPSILPFHLKSTNKVKIEYVRMPCSNRKESFAVQEEIDNRWKSIQKVLGGCKFRNFEDIKNTILSYNAQYSSKWNLDGLREYIEIALDQKARETLLKNTLPKLARLALQLPNLVREAIPLLRKGTRHTITMSQEQAACLLANAFFCTFPPRNKLSANTKGNTFMDINFSRLFTLTETSSAKLHCIFYYFSRVLSKMPHGAISFERRSIDRFPDWTRSTAKFTNLKGYSKGGVEDAGENMLQVDFSNKFVGGGVFLARCVQEEIRFLICPEMIVSRLFMEELEDNECVVMTGCERYSCYTGYGHTFQWSGPYTDSSERDNWNRRKTRVVAIDAKPYKFLGYPYGLQFSKKEIIRELNKAYCGFFQSDADVERQAAGVATGNWGCGGYGGDHELKSILQYMACSVCGRDIAYFTFGDTQFGASLNEVSRLFQEKNLTVGQGFGLISRYNEKYVKPSLTVSPKPTTTLFDFIFSSFVSDPKSDSTNCSIC